MSRSPLCLDSCHDQQTRRPPGLPLPPACKTFDPARKIPDANFRYLLECGRLSPSSFSYEPWRFLVVQYMGLRDRLREVNWGAKGQSPTASHVVCLLARKDMQPGSAYTEHMMRDVHHMSDEAIARHHRFYPQFHETDFRLQDPRALFDWSAAGENAAGHGGCGALGLSTMAACVAAPPPLHARRAARSAMIKECRVRSQNAP